MSTSRNGAACEDALVTLLVFEDGPAAEITLHPGAPEGTLPVAVEALPGLTGWTMKPEGVCRGDACVPVPPGRPGEAPLLRDGRIDLIAFARLLGLPVVHDRDADAWAFGAAAPSRAESGVEAPGFELPDVDGRPHALAEHRGRKVLLLSWASW